MSVEAIRCQAPLPETPKKSVRFKSGSLLTSSITFPSKKASQVDLIEQEKHKLLAKVFLAAQERLIVDKEDYTQESLRDEMWKLVDDKAVGKSDSGRHEFEQTELHALLFDIYKQHYVPSNDPKALKETIEASLDADVVVNEDGTFSLYYSTKCSRSNIEEFLYYRKKDIKNYLYDIELCARKALGKEAADSELVIQKMHQMESEQGLVTKSEIRWHVEESERTIAAGLKNLHDSVEKKNPKAAGNMLISKMFLENLTVHQPTVEELRLLYLHLYNQPFIVSDTRQSESVQLVEQLRPRLIEAKFVISADSKAITMHSSRYPQICMEHITKYVKSRDNEAIAPAAVLEEKSSWGLQSKPLVA